MSFLALHRLVSEFNKFAKNRVQLSAVLNIEAMNTILSEQTIFQLRLEFFKFGLRSIFSSVYYTKSNRTNTFLVFLKLIQLMAVLGT